ncbi:MAG: sensor histidine kinase [Abitibacteriaceae bacterium]|nr:sensor histidine kinase [Abditibacteriaceae bacterium]
MTSLAEQRLFNQLSKHLQQRRAAILHAWKMRAEADPVLSTASQLTRSQFLDGIPTWLMAFNARLCALDTSAGHSDDEEVEQVREEGREHGSHRWEQGYDLREVTREWGHLHYCLIEEMELYRRAHPEGDPELLHLARQALAEAINDSINESVTQYNERQEAEATSHLHDLERALSDMSELERLRGEALRTASHDLRGSLTVAVGASQLLDEAKDPAMRAQIVGMVQRSISALYQMVTALMDLARLEAGQEKRTVQAFDAAALLQQLGETAQPLADARHLTLHTRGPASLPVAGDAVKVQRIAQNLILNALKYTQRGGVEVSWDWHDETQWRLTIRDSGPGIAAATTGEATATGEADTPKAGDAATPVPAHTELPTAHPADLAATDIMRYSEGVGLSIVKRLCELLEARLEMESAVGQGTTFCIFFPRSYASATAPVKE